MKSVSFCEPPPSNLQALEALPLSARQSLLWLDDQLYPEARYHNLVQIIDIEGCLDVHRLAQAFDATVMARDALRLGVDQNEARQFCLDLPIPPLPLIDIEPRQLDAFIAERCVRRLNNGGFLWDAALLRLGPSRHVFYFCQDHIATDGLSMAVFVRDLEDRYLGQPVAGFASFQDYLKLEADYRSSPKAKTDKAYWDSRVAGGAPPLRPYGIVRTDKSIVLDRVWVDADPALAERLLALSKCEAFRSMSPGFSRLLVIATALSALLYRITGNREVLIGAPFGNRRGKFRQTMGLLMEQLFLRIGIEQGDTFNSLAQRVREEMHSAVRHGPTCVSDHGMEYATLNMISRQPTQFAGMPARHQFSPAPTIPGAQPGQGDLRDSLGLQVMDFADGTLQVGFDFHHATFDPRSQAQLSSQFLRVLEALSRDLNTSLDTIPLTNQDDRSALMTVSKGNDQVEPASDVVTQFTENARVRASHTAVVGPDATLSYAELDALTNRLARRLRSLGVERESRVGVAVPRGAGELAALLATLKAGGAYVPVDASHPVERVRVILEDAAPQVLIAPTDSPFAAALPEGAVFLTLDNLTEATRGFDDAPLGETYSQQQLAYILFTSGSTGRPKGVEVGRGAFANFLRSMAHTPGLLPSERLLAITTTTFDIAGLELFLPLYVGATVTVADRDTATDPRRLREALETGTFTTMQATPATWRLLMEAGYQGDGTLRMFVGGEALSPEQAAELVKRGSELWNLYGPTETTIWSSVDRVEGKDPHITIGRPIDRTQFYVLDPALQLVPERLIGEIYIGGDGLARGYRGRPDLTAERFIPDPFGGPEDRVYRTGDLGRVRPDGRFECLGRVDSQVKIRGFRIELGEIESVLRSVPGVQEVVVTLATQKGNAEPRLIAYWVGEAEHDALFERAREKLPQYMIPSAYLRLPSFPLTTSGKIDRKALPAAETIERAPVAVRLPTSPTEIRIARLFSEVLAVSPVGVDQDFFELGGTSILVIQARERFEREFGVELPLHVFFKTPTVSALAAQLERTAHAQETHSCLVQLKPGFGKRALFLIHDADGEVLLYRNLAMRMPKGVAVYGVVPLASGRLPMGHTTIEEMAEHYVKEIRACQPKGPYYVGGLCAGGVIAYEVARHLAEAGERIALLALIEAVSPQAPMRPSQTAHDRLRRSMALLRNVGSSGFSQTIADGYRRMGNLARYEVSRQTSKLWARTLIDLLRRRVLSRATWPAWLSVPSSREIYLNAATHYAPKPVDGVPALLVRAMKGYGSESPNVEICANPDFGWLPLLGRTLQCVDTPGGHSTLLGEETVDPIAQYFLPFFKDS
jgi:amino acid adenylation domain-containing protein